jgi:hypothetical protein
MTKTLSAGQRLRADMNPALARTQARQQHIDAERRLNELDPPVEWARRNEPPPF